MKKFYTFLAISAIIAASAFALTPQLRNTAKAPERVRVAKERPKKTTTSGALRIKGGTNGDKQLYGLLNDNYGDFYADLGASVVSVGDGTLSKAFGLSKDPSGGCYFTRDNTGFVMSVSYGDKIYYDIYNADTGALSTGWSYTTTSPNVYPYDLSYDPETKRIYGFFADDTFYAMNNHAGKLCYIDVENLNILDAIHTVGTVSETMRGLAFDADGQLWGIGEDNSLYQINKVNGNILKIGDLDFSDYGFETAGWFGQESAEIDWETGTLYFSGNNENWASVIVKINTSTCSVEEVTNFDSSYDDVPGIFFKQTPKQSAAPEAVSNATVEAVGVELKASIEFDLPSNNTEGTALTGNVDWTVTDGENTLASGSGTPGQHVTTEAPVTEGGFVNFSITASQNGVSSAPILKQAFIGCDTPVIYGVPDVYPSGSEATVVWNEATSANLGNLAPVTYRVVRQPGDVVIAEETAETQITDKLPTEYKTRCTYEITPTSGTITGAKVSSRPTYIGTVFALPHEDKFEDVTLFNQYPALDANKDGNTWWIDTNRKVAAYSGSNSVAGDDYLCIGPFDLAQGSTYTFYITASAHSGVDYFDVKVGTDPQDASTFATEIVPKTLINTSTVEYVNKIGTFVPETTGRYYFGVHACGQSGTKILYINNIKVTGVSASMPAAPEYTAKSTATGCDFTITVPNKNHVGDGAANAKAIRIYRDQALIAEITDGVTDGATVKYTDTPEPAINGIHAYSISAVNEDGEGMMNTREVYLGLDYPNAPRDLRVYEDLETPGLMHVVWSAPTEGAHGGYIDPAGVTYTVDWNSPTSGLNNVGTSTGFDYQLPANLLNTQGIMAFTVKAYNATGTLAGKSSDTQSGYYGVNYNLPLIESWTTGRSTSGIWAGESIKYDEELFESWWDHTDMNSQDEDGNSMVISTTAADGLYRLRSPRVTLQGSAEPVLVFHVYYTANTKAFYVEAAVDDAPMTELYQVEIDPAKVNTWQRVEVPLTAYKDSKRIQFGFTGQAIAAGEQFAYLDNINIVDKVGNDLQAVTLSAPQKATIGDEVAVKFTLRNVGFNEVKGSDYTLHLMKNGKEVSTLDGEDVASFANADFTFTDKMLPTNPENTVYTVSIDFAADENTDNNSSKEAAVRVVTPNYPTPTNLKAENAAGVALTWDAPSADAIPNKSVTETFDKYDAFIIDGIGNWKTIDNDGAPTAKIATSFGVLNYPHIGEPMAWQVFDPEVLGILDGAWTGHSGKQMIVSFQACFAGTREKNSDDWLISPELDGSAQKISFCARAGAYAYSPELMEIYVSSTGTEISDFKLLEGNIEVPYASDWIEYNYSLPAGTKYFAIVHKSFNKLALLIDDITYIPAGSTPMDLTLTGYNVYRDDELIASVDANTTSYVDKNVEKGTTYKYHVTAVWNKGESGLSNAAEINAEAGLGTISTANVTITGENGSIRVTGANGLTIAVYNTMGRTIAMTTGSAVTEIPVPAAGVYVVRAGQTISKVLVR